jgi:acyl carrier protein
MNNDLKRNSVEEQVINIAKEVFNCEITKDSKIGNPEQWDSLGQLNLFMALEMQLGIKCSPEEVIESDSIEKIIKLLEGK